MDALMTDDPVKPGYSVPWERHYHMSKHLLRSGLVDFDNMAPKAWYYAKKTIVRVHENHTPYKEIFISVEGVIEPLEGFGGKG